MSFTQEKQKNICVCPGCRKHCKLDWEIKNCGDQASCYWAYPVIAGKEIEYYTDRYRVSKRARVLVKKEELAAQCALNERMLDLVHDIAKLCDHYKVR